MARSYEGLKGYMRRHAYRSFADEDEVFYKALRRLYYANVATYLCQYHDSTPLSDDELRSIDTFDRFVPAQCGMDVEPGKLIKEFLEAWGSLKYNLITNEGECYKAAESYEYIEGLAHHYARTLIEQSF